MGSQRAAWQSAFHAENSSLKGDGYLQTLLDIVKAFEKVGHGHLAREALIYDFPLALLRVVVSQFAGERRIVYNVFFRRLSRPTLPSSRDRVSGQGFSDYPSHLRLTSGPLRGRLSLCVCMSTICHCNVLVRQRSSSSTFSRPLLT